MKRILKRSFVLIIAFILVFSISVPCFASDTEHGGGGGFSNDWTEDEKLEYYKYKGQKILHEITGIGRDNIAEDFMDRLYPYWDTRGYSSLEEYLLHELGYDDEEQIFVPSQNLTVDINTCIQGYNDSVTMVYRYPLNKANIDASNFPNKVVFDAFVDLLDAFPDCYFYINSSDCQNPNFIIDGVRNNFGSAYRVQVVKPFSGVNAYPDLVTTPVTFYGDDWEVSPMSLFWIVSSDEFKTSDNISYFELTNYDDYNNMNYGNYYLNLNDLESAGFSFSSGSCASLSMCNKFSWSRTFTDFYTPYSASDVPINVYKTVADMKKDIGSQFIGSYTPNYTGSCAPSVNVDVINNFEIPDSGSDGGNGSGSGSDDNGGGSSGGVFDDIISGIASGVGSIIKGIFSIIKDLVDAIADAIVSIAKSITDLSSLLKTDFTDFLSAVFPFLPQEFITIMIAGLTLCLLGIIIKIFRG